MPDPSPIAHALAIRAARAHRAYLESLASLEAAKATRDNAIILAIDAGMSYGKLAKVVGVPRGTVQSVVRRGVKEDG